jgi:ABC-type multidrug transport system fused ATPase/permease subunit
MYSSLRKLFGQFAPEEKRRLVAFLIVIIISGIVQVIGIASIFPFIGVATNPELIETNIYLSQFKQLTGLNSNNEFLVFLGFIVLIMLIVSNAFIAFTTWLTMKFVVNNTHKFSLRLMQRYLGESYEFHLQRNSAQLIKNLTTEISRVVSGGMMSSLEICSKGITCLLILSLLIFVDPKIAIMMGLLIGGAYLLIYYLIRIKLSVLGKRAGILFGLRFKNINEALGGIKDLMVLQRQGHYLRELRTVTEEIISIQVINRTAADLPKYIVETVAFGGILSITIYLIITKSNTSEVMPIIALYGFSAMRLMPAMQSIFKATATLKHDISAVDEIYRDLVGTSAQPFNKNLVENPNTNKLKFEKIIKIQSLSYTYPNSRKKALTEVSIDIKKYSSIGIIGSSGSGKSTLVDILLGLLKPQSGHLFVDHTELNPETVSLWKNDIGYVPQSIFLADSTIIENIAFGIPKENIDKKAIVEAAKMANIHNFIVDELEDGYETTTGERGVRLSGGQRQRIGIARALYHKPQVLIFDEATSALDNTSEKIVMDAVNSLHGKITIVMIAHRLSTVKACDKLVWLEKGKLKATGAFDELMQTNPEFNAFADPTNESNFK